MEQEIKRNIPRDVFLHLLAIVTLYWSAITFVTLLWQYINYYLPDVLNYYYQGTNYAIRFAVSSLVIVFPIFILDLLSIFSCFLWLPGFLFRVPVSVSDPLGAYLL